MPQVGRTSIVASSNSIGAKATTVALIPAHVATHDGILELQIKISAAAAQLQVSVIDTESSPNTDTALLNGTANLIEDKLYGPGEILLYMKVGYSYTFSMVFSTGTPVCDMLQLAEIDVRGDQ